MLHKNPLFCGLSTLFLLAAWLILMTGTAQAQTCPEGMVSYWALDETGTPTSFADSSGVNTNTGACAGTCPAPAEGIQSGALQFDGILTGIDVPNHPSLNWTNEESFSVELWINTTQPGTDTKVFIGKNIFTPQWWVGYDNTNQVIFFLIDSNGTVRQIKGLTVVNDGSWHHLVAVRDAGNSQLRLYVDGVPDADPVAASFSGDFISTAPLNLGYLVNNYHYNGLMDEVAIYGSALTDAEVKAHYNAQEYLGRGYCELCDEPVRIMPLGDSLTEGSASGTVPEGDATYYISYRKDLFESLKAGGYDVDMVGSLSGGSAYSIPPFDPPFDPNHEGHGGQGPEYIRDNIISWLGSNPAEVILLHIGTNAVNGSTTPAEITAAVSQVNQILDNIDSVENSTDTVITVILARIINRMCCTLDEPCDACQNVATFNSELNTMAQGRIALGDKLIVVDMEQGAGINYWGYLDPPPEGPGDMYGDIHPWTTGYAKMAALWYGTLDDLLPVCIQLPAPPSIISTPKTTATEGRLYRYDVDAVGNPTPTYALTTFPTGMTINPASGLIEWTPSAAQLGPHPVVVAATNTEGTDTQSFTVTVSAQPPCPEGMSHYWTLDGTGGPYEDFYTGAQNALCDASCPTAATGIVEGGQQFNGSNDELTVADDNTFDWGAGDSFSIEYWMKTNTLPGNIVMVSRSGGGVDWWVGSSGGRVWFQLQSTLTETVIVSGGPALTDDLWHHIVAVRDGIAGENRIYVDGALIDSELYTYTGGFASGAALNIGHYLNDYHYFGIFDEVALYNRALDLTDIQAHYNNRNGVNYCSGCQSDEDCVDPTKPVCDTANNVCVECTDNTHCDDGIACTDDTCSLNLCQYVPNNTLCSDGNLCTDDLCTSGVGCSNPNNSLPCDDGLYCNGTDTCSGGTCSVHSGNPCPGTDGDGNCAESCNETADNCTAADPNGSACDDGLFCNGTDTCNGSSCSFHAGDPCTFCDVIGCICDEAIDYCSGCDSDTDCDGICDPEGSSPYCGGSDNCPITPNPGQEDTYPPDGNSVGDACDCEGNFDCDSDVDGSDASLFKGDFGRSFVSQPCSHGSPCNGDFNCDRDVDGSDAFIFKQDFGRNNFQNPCTSCSFVCNY